MCTFYDTLWLLLTDEEQGLKEKELWFALSLLCLLLRHFQPSGWLEQGSNRSREAEVVSCSFVFLGMATASLCVEVGSVSPLTQYRWNTRTLCSLGVHWAPIACGSCNSVLLEHWRVICTWDRGAHIVLVFCVHTRAPSSHQTSLTKPSSKIKLQKVSRWQQQDQTKDEVLLGFSREIEARKLYLFIKLSINQGTGLQLWRLRSLTTYYLRLDAAPGNPVVQFQSKGRRRPMLQLKESGKDRILPSSTSLFRSGPQWIRWCSATSERVLLAPRFWC